MKILEINNEEKDICFAFIKSSVYIDQIKKLYDPSYLEDPIIRKIVSECLSYHSKYEKAPKLHIFTIFEKQKYKLDDEIYNPIIKFLKSIKEKLNQEFNVHYYVDSAKKYFSKRSLEDFNYQLGNMIDADNINGATELLSNYTILNETSGIGIDLFNTPEKVNEAFGEDLKPLFKFPKPLGKLINNNLVRGGFISIIAPNKRGKSFLINEMFIRSLIQRNNTLMVQIGDLSENDVIQRLAISLARKHYLEEDCKNIIIPVHDCFKNQNNSCRLNKRSCRTGIIINPINEQKLSLDNSIKRGYIPCDYCRKLYPDKYFARHWFKKLGDKSPLNKDSAYRIFSTFNKRLKGIRGMLYVCPTDSLSPGDLKGLLNIWSTQDQFIPSVIIVDSADNMTERNKDFRHMTNQIWSGLRSIALSYNILVITTTQADTDSFEQEIITRKNFTDDRRKLDHVTASYGINQTDEEKEEMIIRINNIINRTQKYNPKKCIHVMQCLSIGKAFLGAYERYESRENKNANTDKKNQNYKNS